MRLAMPSVRALEMLLDALCEAVEAEGKPSRRPRIFAHALQALSPSKVVPLISKREEAIKAEALGLLLALAMKHPG